MNRQPLADLTPEHITDAEEYVQGYKGGNTIDLLAWVGFCDENAELIIECMRVALRWRNEMDQMKEERG